MSQNYTILISEAQRAIIESALARAAEGRAPAFDFTPEDEPAVLHYMFRSLPEEELEVQKAYGLGPAEATHGFAY